MIRNDRQYKISRARAEEFAQFLDSRSANIKSEDEWSDLELSAVKSQLDDLREEIDEYENLKKGKITSVQISSFEELPTVLVKARIASGLTQKELANKLGLKEQQIQRYEQSEYAGVSIDRIREIIDALDLSVKQDIVFPTQNRSIKELASRLELIGIDQALLKNRFLPSTSKRMMPDDQLTAMVQRLSRVYGWNPASLLSPTSLQLPTAAMDRARFKLPSKIDTRRLHGYCRAKRRSNICAYC